MTWYNILCGYTIVRALPLKWQSYTCLFVYIFIYWIFIVICVRSCLYDHKSVLGILIHFFILAQVIFRALYRQQAWWWSEKKFMIKPLYRYSAPQAPPCMPVYAIPGILHWTSVPQEASFWRSLGPVCVPLQITMWILCMQTTVRGTQIGGEFRWRSVVEGYSYGGH